MVGTKFLSELIDCSGLKKDSLNIIKAPTGSGKTYFALTHIPSLVEDAHHNVVYLIDTINGKEQILQNYNAIADNRMWIADVEGEGLWFVPNDKVVIMTYAKFGFILTKHPDFHTHFDYIICDELHNLPKFIGYSPRPNSHSIAKEGIERAVANDRTTVIALTATPSSIPDAFRASTFTVPVDDSQLIQYETNEVIRYTNLEYMLSSFDPAEIGICYVSRITAMEELVEVAKEQGLSPIAIWSIRNKEHPMTAEQLVVRRIILDTYTIPPQYNLLIINASAETSIKIKSPVDYVVVHSSNVDTQTQVRGRVNGDLKRIYLPATDDAPIVVPEEFLGRRLFSADKSALCEALNQRNPSNRLRQWTSIKPLLLNYDYEITEGRYENKRYAIITLSPE